MEFDLVKKVSNLSRSEFEKKYLSTRTPVILTDLSEDWRAREEWTFDFFRKNYGHWEVPMYDASYHKPGNSYMKPVFNKNFGEYLDIIEREPTTLRFHNFQILKRAPELANYYQTPQIMGGFVKFALLFFGGKGAALNLHYDIDCSHVFLTHFQTTKKVYLFSPEDSRSLYQLPFTNHSKVNVLDPDYEKYPALKGLKGYEAHLEHGETLFIPQMWWHYVYYSDGGFSLALRANDSFSTRIRGLWNLLRLFTINKGMNALMGARWEAYKNDTARKRALVRIRQ